MKYIAFILLCLAPLPSLASDFESRSVAPEYSGPSARIESRGMDRAGNPQLVRTPYEENFSNDYSVEFENMRRGERVQSEMNRRRDEVIRANQEHILKINE